MGRYIDDILQPEEKVLYSTNAHWIVHWKGILGWIVAAGLLVLSGMVPNEGLVLTLLVVLRRGGDRRDVLERDSLVPSLDHRDRRHQSARRPQDKVSSSGRHSR